MSHVGRVQPCHCDPVLDSLSWALKDKSWFYSLILECDLLSLNELQDHILPTSQVACRALPVPGTLSGHSQVSKALLDLVIDVPIWWP